MCGESKEWRQYGLSRLRTGFRLGIEPVGELNGQIDAVFDQFGLFGGRIGVFPRAIKGLKEAIELVGVKALPENGILARPRKIVL